MKNSKVKTRRGGEVARRLIVPSIVTSGQYCVFELKADSMAGEGRHLHRFEEESLIICSGRWLVDVGSHVRTAKAGDVICLPRGIPHEFRNISARPGRLLAVFSPGDIESLFVESEAHADMERFGVTTLPDRLKHGGMPNSSRTGTKAQSIVAGALPAIVPASEASSW